MARSIMQFIPQHENVAQKIKSREYLHSYPCQKCGIERVVTVWQGNRSPMCRSCSASEHGFTIRRRNHPVYSVWKGMKERCMNPKSVAYKNYGGRGISVCNEWKDPERFVSWCLANGWRSGLHIDRINVDGHYEPSNCRFVTPQENSTNKRDNRLDVQSVRLIRMLCWSGMSCSDVAKIFGITKSTSSRVAGLRTWSHV